MAGLRDSILTSQNLLPDNCFYDTLVSFNNWKKSLVLYFEHKDKTTISFSSFISGMQSTKWMRRQKEEKRHSLPYHKLLFRSSSSRWSMQIPIILSFWTLPACMEVPSILIRFYPTAQGMQIKTIIAASTTPVKPDSRRLRRIILEIFNIILKNTLILEKKGLRE